MINLTHIQANSLEYYRLHGKWTGNAVRSDTMWSRKRGLINKGCITAGSRGVRGSTNILVNPNDYIIAGDNELSPVGEEFRQNSLIRSIAMSIHNGNYGEILVLVDVLRDLEFPEQKWLERIAGYNFIRPKVRDVDKIEQYKGNITALREATPRLLALGDNYPSEEQLPTLVAEASAILPGVDRHTIRSIAYSLRDYEARELPRSTYIDGCISMYCRMLKEIEDENTGEMWNWEFPLQRVWQRFFH